MTLARSSREHPQFRGPSTVAWIGAVVYLTLFVFLLLASLAFVVKEIVFDRQPQQGITGQAGQNGDSGNTLDSKTKESLQQQCDALAAIEQSLKDQRVSLEGLTGEFERVKKVNAQVNDKVSDLDTQLTNIKKRNDELNEAIQEMSGRIQKVQTLLSRLGRSGTLIYFVHTSELQESVFHSIWQELAQELDGDRELLVCRAQEGNTLVAVYPEERSLNTPAAEASRTVTPETFKQAVNEAREHFRQKDTLLDKIIVICDDRFAGDSIKALEASQHYGDALPPAVYVIALQLSQPDQSSFSTGSLMLPNMPTGVFIHRCSFSQGNQKEDLKDVLRSVLRLGTREQQTSQS
jgi:chaperonin cofactor prefoldin